MHRCAHIFVRIHCDSCWPEHLIVLLLEECCRVWIEHVPEFMVIRFVSDDSEVDLTTFSHMNLGSL